jgi:hypothetical protein
MTFAVLRPNTRQLHQVGHLGGHLAVVVLEQSARCSLHALGLLPEEARGVQHLLQLHHVGARERGRVGPLREQHRRDRVDARIGGLGREDRGHQELKGRLVIELAQLLRGARVLRFEAHEDLTGAALGRARTRARGRDISHLR